MPPVSNRFRNSIAAAWQLLLAIGIAGAFQLIELAWVPQLVDRWQIPESANYVSWLSTVAQIGGVFIALYFTAVTADINRTSGVVQPTD